MVSAANATDVEDLGCMCHDLADAVEQALDRVEAEGPELVELFGWLARRLNLDSIGFAP